MASVPDETAARAAGRTVKTRGLGPGRYSFELGRDERPEAFIAGLAASGATLLSAMPIRTTLEDVFLRALEQERRPETREAPAAAGAPR
jgi:hypothetical protein